jgi:hypothetical protein
MSISLLLNPDPHSQYGSESKFTTLKEKTFTRDLKHGEGPGVWSGGGGQLLGRVLAPQDVGRDHPVPLAVLRVQQAEHQVEPQQNVHHYREESRPSPGTVMDLPGVQD